uniref:Putative DNA methyltransferase n=1 Tax=Tydemania expeditionis TaxID=325645 RepID=A0A0D6E2S8_TYDEX|nr:putative DNA methyltransferase [Tydemania expeditionis]CEO91077.1 putative DNA methyltransferase [Tydemania expeditionis]
MQNLKQILLGLPQYRWLSIFNYLLLTNLKKIPFTFIDLFSGIGSFHYSLKSLGGKCVLACDIDKNANSTYIFNYGVVPHKNIFDLQLEQIPNSDMC